MCKLFKTFRFYTKCNQYKILKLQAQNFKIKKRKQFRFFGALATRFSLGEILKIFSPLCESATKIKILNTEPI